MSQLLRSLAGRAALPAAAQQVVVDADPKRLSNGPVGRMLAAEYPVDGDVIARLARAGTQATRGMQIAGSPHLQASHVDVLADHADRRSTRRMLLLAMCAHRDEQVQLAAAERLGDDAAIRPSETRLRTSAAFAVWGGTAVRDRLLTIVGDDTIIECGQMLTARGGHALPGLHGHYGPLIPTDPTDPFHQQVVDDLLATDVAFPADVDAHLTRTRHGTVLPFTLTRPPRRSRAEQDWDAVKEAAEEAAHVTDEQILSRSAHSRVTNAARYPHACARIRDLLVDRLGDDQAAWSTFAALADTSTGTFGDLLDTVVHLSELQTSTSQPSAA